jgi:hypothetical protein
MATLETMTIKGMAVEVLEDQLLQVCTPKYSIVCEEMVQYFFARVDLRLDEHVSIVTIKPKADGAIVLIVFASVKADQIFTALKERLEKYAQISHESIVISYSEDTM